MTTPTAPATAAAPVKATLKGHGNPTQIMYFGVERTPFAPRDGWKVDVINRGRAGYELVDPTGAHPASTLSSAAKFWGAPTREDTTMTAASFSDRISIAADGIRAHWPNLDRPAAQYAAAAVEALGQAGQLTTDAPTVGDRVELRSARPGTIVGAVEVVQRGEPNCEVRVSWHNRVHDFHETAWYTVDQFNASWRVVPADPAPDRGLMPIDVTYDHDAGVWLVRATNPDALRECHEAHEVGMAVYELAQRQQGVARDAAEIAARQIAQNLRPDNDPPTAGAFLRDDEV